MMLDPNDLRPELDSIVIIVRTSSYKTAFPVFFVLSVLVQTYLLKNK